MQRSAATLLLGLSGAAALALPPPTRNHTTVQSQPLRVVPANQEAPAAPQVQIAVEGPWRVVRGNGLPAHLVGRFPNRTNPHTIEAQQLHLRVPAEPTVAERTTELELGPFGVATNGVLFDPGAAEWFRGQRGSIWRYEALSGAVPLGVDANHAHVQPSGIYHYHGIPTGLLEDIPVAPGAHGALVGWAADGFPIYALQGHREAGEAASPVVALRPSWQLRTAERPGGAAPSGMPDGTFVADYEYVAGSGDLDRCNGRHTVTPEFPEGTYAYFLTTAWPVIPRCFVGTPSPDFDRRAPPPGRRGPPQGRPPPR